MRHRNKSERFSRSRAQKKALVNSLLKSVIIHGRIKTITSRAKYLRGQIENLITRAKEDCLFHRRLTYRKLGDHRLVKRLFEVIAPQYKDISGGYSRIIAIGSRKGDGADLSLLELTKYQPKKKIHKSKKGKVKAEHPDKHEERIAPKKEVKPKKGLISGVRKIFKKERDAL